MGKTVICQGTDKNECRLKLIELTERTHILKVYANDLDIYTLVRQNEKEYLFRRIALADTTLNNLELLCKKYECIKVKASAINSTFAPDDIQNLKKEKIMFCAFNGNSSYYMIPTKEFMATFVKNLGLSGSGFKKPSLLRDVFLASTLYSLKEDQYVYFIVRKVNNNSGRLYSCVSQQFKLFPQKEVFSSIREAEKTVYMTV